MSVTAVLFSSLPQNVVLIVKAHALTTQNLALFSVSKPFLLKEKTRRKNIYFSEQKKRL